MAYQKVFRISPGNGIDTLKESNEPIPEIDKYEALIKVHSVALNFRDIAIATGQYPLPVKDQVVPCSDMSGEVVQVGELVKGLSVGDRVISILDPTFLYGSLKDANNTLGGTIDGVLREYVALPGHSLVKLPKTPHNLSEWAALVGTGSTVWNCFYGNKTLKPGETVLMLGTGGVSLTALIYAKAAGAKTIITSSSDEKLSFVKANYGVDYTINYKTHPNWAAEVQRITNGEGVDHVIENGGVGTIEQSLQSVAWGGVISLVGFLTTKPPGEMPNVVIGAISKGVNLRGILGGSKQQLEEAVRFMASQNLPMPVHKRFDFNHGDITAALKYIEAGEHMGKVCINLY